MEPLVIPFEKLRMTDVEQVGGKNASLGEMISQLADTGVRVPGGFATTAHAYRIFLAQSGLDEKINATLDALDVDDVNALARAGAEIRQWVLDTPFPMELTIAITEQYQRLVADSSAGMSFAVRSSATAEDLPDASFAGQQETFLNIVGLENIMHAIKEVFASLYNDRAISYRVHKGFIHADVALSAGIQRMVRSDKGAAGVMFTLDTESGFRDAVFVTSGYGLGETVVQGAVNPDEFYVHKPTLAAGKKAVVRRNLGSKMIKMTFAAEKVAGKSTITEDVEESLRHQFSINDEEVMELARYAQIIEQHSGRPMDIEWGKDGATGTIYILQARPETVQSRAGRTLQRFRLKATPSRVLTSGRSIGQRIGSGPARVIRDVSEMARVQAGDVLVADMTDPDWEPVMKRAAAIVTNRGGRTCHAAIIARELGVAAVVGCGNATSSIRDGQNVTVS
ncbi:phosphoenolpyruvate synthase, partial [Azonexus sp.]|uniref:phosphoenolpyruvate synthase n=1 Tax=Azonexus sp. TaxID=1872668 RepID=UPI0028355F74